MSDITGAELAGAERDAPEDVAAEHGGSEMALPAFTPERAERYAAQALPEVLARAAANLGEPMADGSLHPEPSARAARLAILSAREILAELGPLLSDDLLIPQRAALARLERLFIEQRPDLPLAMPRGEGPPSLVEMVDDAWTASARPQRAVEGQEVPGVGLPSRGAGLDL